MRYSRRQLEALGEPLGESVTRLKPGGNGRIFGDGGGDGGSNAPPANTTQVTIPDYAKPYMERVLGKAEALTDAPYQTYNQNRIAGSTEEQQAARSAVAGLQAPGQYEVATGLAGAAGLEGLRAGQYGPGQFDAGYQARDYGPSGFNTMFASPERAGFDTFGADQARQYMSPFMQNVVDVQKNAAIRDAQKAQLGASLGAARQGTYGGARQLLATTERERALGSQMGEIQAKGLQSAFEQAQQQFERDQSRRMSAQQLNVQSGLQAQLANQQAMLDAQRMGEQSRQFGATFGESSAARQAALGMEAQKAAEQSRQFGAEAGLRGAGQAIQAATSLGQLGTAEQQSALERARAQETFGGLGQAEQQRALDLAYQDFLAQQQFPYKNIGFMSDILRGSANLAGTGGKMVYEAQPSQLSQIVGPGLLGLGIYREFMK
jgi:hypothetical protein